MQTARSASQVDFIVAMRISKLDQTGRFVRSQGLLGSFWRLQGRSSSSCLLALRWPRMKLMEGSKCFSIIPTEYRSNNTTMTVIFMHLFVCAQMFMTMLSTGGHIRNCTERAAGPGELKNSNRDGGSTATHSKDISVLYRIGWTGSYLES